MLKSSNQTFSVLAGFLPLSFGGCVGEALTQCRLLIERAVLLVCVHPYVFYYFVFQAIIGQTSRSPVKAKPTIPEIGHCWPMVVGLLGLSLYA